MKPDTEINLSSLSVENQNSLATKTKYMGFTDTQNNIISGLEQILRYCHHFSKELIKEEISFYISKGKQKIVDHLEKISSYNKLESPVIRIGKDEGYNSLTVGLAVKKLDPKLYEDVLIHATKNISYDSKHGGPLPKSRKIVHWNGEETTAGWIQLIPENISVQYTASSNLPEQKPVTKTDLSILENKFKVTKK